MVGAMVTTGDPIGAVVLGIAVGIPKGEGVVGEVPAGGSDPKGGSIP